MTSEGERGSRLVQRLRAMERKVGDHPLLLSLSCEPCSKNARKYQALQDSLSGKRTAAAESMAVAVAVEGDRNRL